MLAESHAGGRTDGRDEAVSSRSFANAREHLRDIYVAFTRIM